MNTSRLIAPVFSHGRLQTPQSRHRVGGPLARAISSQLTFLPGRFQLSCERFSNFALISEVGRDGKKVVARDRRLHHPCGEYRLELFRYERLLSFF